MSSEEEDNGDAFLTGLKPHKSIAEKTISQAGLTKQGSEYIPTVLPNESFKKSSIGMGGK